MTRIGLAAIALFTFGCASSPQPREEASPPARSAASDPQGKDAPSARPITSRPSTSGRKTGGPPYYLCHLSGDPVAQLACIGIKEACAGLYFESGGERTTCRMQADECIALMRDFDKAADDLLPKSSALPQSRALLGDRSGADSYAIGTPALELQASKYSSGRSRLARLWAELSPRCR
ncbi:MAG: hypothetical protein U0271_30815 [Polyangiaceae bacterium]